MRIPKKFTLGGTEFEVVLDNLLNDRRDSLGYIFYDQQRIHLATHSCGKPVPFARLQQVFVHELLHALHIRMGRPKRFNHSMLDGLSVGLAEAWDAVEGAEEFYTPEELAASARAFDTLTF